MAIKRLDLKENKEWLAGDLFAVQLHNLELNDDGTGKTESTTLTYDGKVLEVEDGKISRAILQKEIEDGKFEQHTMPLKRVSDLISESKDGGQVVLETYSPIYTTENPPQRYLFTIIAGARIEGDESEGTVKVEEPKEKTEEK